MPTASSPISSIADWDHRHADAGTSSNDHRTAAHSTTSSANGPNGGSDIRHPVQQHQHHAHHHVNDDDRRSSSDTTAGSAPAYALAGDDDEVQLLRTHARKSTHSEHSIPMDDIVAPKARHGAVWLHPKPSKASAASSHRRQRNRQAEHAARWTAEHAWARLRTGLSLLANPRELAASVHQHVHAQWIYWDRAFRDPMTDQRIWWPPWLASYVPLLIWVGISVMSTTMVMLFHVQLFHALDVLSTTLRSLGLVGRVLFGMIIFVLTFPPMPLYSTMIVLSGFAFGMWQGFLVSYVAALTGAASVFVLSRTHLRAWMMRLLAHAGGLQRVIRAIELRPQLLFLVRLAPYPYNLLNMLLASSHVLTFRTYITCTALALPKLLVHTSIGASIESFASYHSAANETQGADPSHKKTNTVRQVFGGFGIALCVGIFLYLYYVTRRAVDTLDSDEGEDAESLDESATTDMEDDKDPLASGVYDQSKPGTPLRRVTPLELRRPRSVIAWDHLDRLPPPPPEPPLSWLAESIEQFERAAEQRVL